MNAPPKVLKPVFPNQAIAAQYRAQLEVLVDDMSAGYERALLRQYRADPPEMALDARSERFPKRVTAVRTVMGDGRPGWAAYVDGRALRGARPFRTRAAAEAAGLKAAGPGGVLTVPRVAKNVKVPFADLELQPLPAESLGATLSGLDVEWTARIDAMAPKMADWFAKAADERSRSAMRKILKDGGVTVRSPVPGMTKKMQDVLRATVQENVSLIRSIHRQYHTEVEGLVMRSVTTGRDLKTLTDELEHRYGVTRRRAELIARDQNNKATAVISRVRQQAAGITQAVWLHSHGGREPRKTHLANSGKVYDVAKGWFDPDPKVRKRIWPGELINCRCVAKPIVPGFS